MLSASLRASLLALLLLASCDRAAPPFGAIDITGANYARDFSLTDHRGAKRELADYRGKVVVIFFGFTQCPDVCPTTMADMAQVKQKLGGDGEGLQVIFVTVDPERDTQELLAEYVPRFDASFVGLRGGPEEIARVAKEFKVFYQKVPGPTPTSYSVDHTAGSYVFDREGKVRLFVRHSLGIDAIVADLRRLL